MENNVINDVQEAVNNGAEEILANGFTDVKVAGAAAGTAAILVTIGYLGGKFHVVGRAFTAVKNFGKKLFSRKPKEEASDTEEEKVEE